MTTNSPSGPSRLSDPRGKVAGMTATLIRPSGGLPGAHPDHPFADCARCYGETYGAALAAAIQDRRQDGQPLSPRAVHDEAAARLAQGLAEPLLCPTHKRVPRPRWTPTQIEYARRVEALSGRLVVGVVIDDDEDPIGHAVDCESCMGHARNGRRVIIVRDCPDENRSIDCIQRVCDTRYRLAVPL